MWDLHMMGANLLQLHTTPAALRTALHPILEGACETRRRCASAGWVSILAAVGIIFLICAVIMASKVLRGPTQGPFGITIPGVASDARACIDGFHVFGSAMATPHHVAGLRALPEAHNGTGRRACIQSTHVQWQQMRNSSKGCCCTGRRADTVEGAVIPSADDAKPAPKESPQLHRYISPCVDVHAGPMPSWA